MNTSLLVDTTSVVDVSELDPIAQQIVLCSQMCDDQYIPGTQCRSSTDVEVDSMVEG